MIHKQEARLLASFLSFYTTYLSKTSHLLIQRIRTFKRCLYNYILALVELNWSDKSRELSTQRTWINYYKFNTKLAATIGFKIGIRLISLTYFEVKL